VNAYLGKVGGPSCLGGKAAMLIKQQHFNRCTLAVGVPDAQPTYAGGKQLFYFGVTCGGVPKPVIVRP